MQAEILNCIENGSTVYTDGYPAYDQLHMKDSTHQVINHTVEYVRRTQGIDNFWALLKGTLTGTYVAVEPFHLDRSVTEQVFRYNTRATKDNPLTDADAVALLLSRKSLAVASPMPKSLARLEKQRSSPWRLKRGPKRKIEP